MHLEGIIAIIVFNYLRKSLRTSGFVAQKDRQLIIGIALSVSFLVLGSVFSEIELVISWLVHALFFWIVYIILTWQEFRKVKSLVYAFLPIVILSIVSDVTG